MKDVVAIPHDARAPTHAQPQATTIWDRFGIRSLLLQVSPLCFS